MAKFADIVKEWGITADQIVAASRAVEVRSASDRLLAIERRQIARTEKKIVDSGVKKPKLGRALTVKSVDLAIAGLPQSRIVRSKLVRAVNQLAKFKKKTAVNAIDLFGDTKRRRGQPPAKKGAKK